MRVGGWTGDLRVNRLLTNASTGPLCSAGAPQIGPLRRRYVGVPLENPYGIQ